MSLALDPSTSTKRELNSILEKVLNEARIDDDESKTNVQIMKQVTESLETAMRIEDPLFDELCQRQCPSGSYFDRLKIAHADEFDTTWVLSLPFGKKQVKVVREAPGKVQLQVIRDVEEALKKLNSKKWTPKLYQRLATFFYDNGKLSQSDIHEWIKEVYEKALNSTHFQKPASVEKVVDKSGSVAFTLGLHLKNGDEIDIDLTPVITTAKYKQIKGINKSSLNQLKPEHREMLMVTKPPSRSQMPSASGLSIMNYRGIYCGLPKKRKSRRRTRPRQKSSAEKNLAELVAYLSITDEDSEEGDQNFQMDFILAERKLLGVGGCAKKLIRLFKIMRDKNEWDIKSFKIKNFFLLEFDKRENWEDCNLGSLFVMMLEKWKSALDEKRLPYYFDKKDNLFESMDSSTAKKISAEVDVIISKILRDPNAIADYM